jgi:hypothetical protein
MQNVGTDMLQDSLTLGQIENDGWSAQRTLTQVKVANIDQTLMVFTNKTGFP